MGSKVKDTVEFSLDKFRYSFQTNPYCVTSSFLLAICCSLNDITLSLLFQIQQPAESRMESSEESPPDNSTNDSTYKPTEDSSDSEDEVPLVKDSRYA